MKNNWRIICAFLMVSIFALSLVTACDDDDDTSSDSDTDGDTDGDTDTDTDSDTDSDTDGDGQFGDPCETVEDCDIEGEENVCHDFGQLGLVCTFTCEGDDDCPEGSEGQKCNNSNVCRP